MERAQGTVTDPHSSSTRSSARWGLPGQLTTLHARARGMCSAHDVAFLFWLYFFWPYWTARGGVIPRGRSRGGFTRHVGHVAG